MTNASTPVDRQATIPPRVARRFLMWAALSLVALGCWTAAFLVAEPLAKWFTGALLGLPEQSRTGASLAYFLGTAPRVLLLLVAVLFVTGIGSTFFTPERVKTILARKHPYFGNAIAALFGVVTPFCSCSAVPMFIGFVEAGVPLGVTLSFLIAAPVVNEVALVLLAATFGWRIALLYLSTGLSIAIGAGILLGRLKLEGHIEPWVFARLRFSDSTDASPVTAADRLASGVANVRKIASKVWHYVVMAIAVGALIHGYVPEGLLSSVLGRDSWWAVPIVVLVGIPLYSTPAALIPLVQPILAKGAALGTILAFMMAVAGLSLPELIILRRVMRPRLIAAFVGVVALGILMTGWLFNAVI